MSFPVVALPVMRFRLVGGVKLGDVLLGRVVGAAVVGVLGWIRRAGAQQDATLEHVQLREPHRASRGAYGGRTAAPRAFGIRQRNVTHVGPPCRLYTREER